MQVNPYQSPQSEAGEAADRDESFVPSRCPNCHSPVTFWVAVRQAVPFRFRCPTCRAQFAVQAPGLLPISAFVFVGMFFAGGVASAALFYVGASPGWLIPFLILGYAAIEWGLHRYIQHRGEFRTLRP